MTKLTCFPNKPIASGMKIRFEFLFVKTNFAFILTGYALFGHDFIKFNVSDYSKCALKCMANDTCHSYNLQAKKSRHKYQICELNNQSRISKPGDFKHKQGYIHNGAVPVGLLETLVKLFYVRNNFELFNLLSLLKHSKYSDGFLANSPTTVVFFSRYMCMC